MRIVTCASVALMLLGLAAGGCLRDKDKNQAPAEDVSADEQAASDHSSLLDASLDVPSGTDIQPGDLPSPGDVASDQTAPPTDVGEVQADASEAISCTPNCGTRVCGDDGCGGGCGICTGDQECTGAGTCSAAALIDCLSAWQTVSACGYTPQCLADTLATVGLTEGKELTDFVNCLAQACPQFDGLCTQNATVGECSGFYNACADTPPCVAECTGKLCGNDGCGGTCGACNADQYCDGTACQPAAGACPGSGIPLGACAPSLNMIGCCTEEQRLYYCDGTNAMCMDCAASGLVCGWGPSDFYECVPSSNPQQEDPSGTYPRLCIP